MIKIISVSNAHEFDGAEVNQYCLDCIITALSCSRYCHTIKYLEDGVETIAFIGEPK